MRALIRRIFTILVAVGWLAAPGVASAQQLLTFDEMAPDATAIPILGSVVCSASTGFRFDSDHFHIVGPDYGDSASNGSTYLAYEAGSGSPITMSREGSGTFALLSLDAGEFFLSNLSTSPAQWIELTGHQDGGGVVTHSIFVDGLRDGHDGIVDFEHFVLPPTFVNLRSVVFTGWRDGGAEGDISFDNLEYQLDSPETIPPCTFIDTHPIVSIVSPNQAVVSGVVTIDANATDNVALASVAISVDGVPLAPPLTSTPYQLQWDTTTVADGVHTIEVEATDTTDVVGAASSTLVVQNNVVVSQGPHYVSFDGVDDYAFAADAPALSFGTGTADTPFTIEMWVRPNSVLGRHQLIGKAGEYRVAFIMGAVLVQLTDDSAQAFSTVATAPWFDITGLVGGWHHLAVTYDGRGGATAGDGVTIYLDGVAAPVIRETTSGYLAMENLAGAVQFGRNQDQEHHYSGGLDEVRIWNAVRSASEIQFAMGAELTGLEAGLTGYWRFNEGAGLAAADDSSNDQTAALMNGTAWLTDGPFAPDTTAPQISGISVSNVTSSGATITFSTDEVAVAWASYAQGSCPCTDVYSAGAGSSHTIQLTGLAAETEYQFTINARDGANNARTSTTMSFQTLAPSIDVQPPTVTFVTPASGPVAGIITVEATATDAVGVTSVEFFVGGVSLGAADTTPPYTLQWNTTSAADGAYTIVAEARDTANNVGTASRMVTVQNAAINPGGPHYVSFDGVDDYGSTADAPAHSFGTGTADTPFTIEMWVRPDSVVGRHQLIGKAGEYRVAFIMGTVFVQLTDASADAFSTVATAPALDISGLVGSWHHVAVTYDGRGGATASDGITIYLDGVAVPVIRETTSGYVAMENLAGAVEIGRNQDQAHHYAGGLDELRIWDVVRTGADILGNMSVELSGGEAGLRAYWRFNEGVGTSVADDSANNSFLTLSNGVLWAADGPIPEDTTAPQLSNIAVSNITTSGATITFTTNEPATGSISYVAGSACPCTEVPGSGVGTAHTVTLVGLVPATSYQFTARAIDASDNSEVSQAMTFQTLPVPDVLPPTVAFVTPAAGTVAGLVAVQATATDNATVVSVTFLLDGVALGAPDTTAPYALQWDSIAAVDGEHTLTAEARDSSNNVNSATVVVQVQNTPVSVLAATVTNNTIVGTITGGPGNRTDWISLSPADGGPGVDWRYLNNQKAVPPNGLTNGTVTFPARTGRWVLKYFLNDSLTDLFFVSAPFTITPAPDTTAPQLSNIVVSSITATGATITFTTNEPATGSISYVAGSACPCTVSGSTALGTAHTITLVGLTPATSYQFTARAADEANNQQTSTAMTFQTLPMTAAGLTATVVNDTIVGTITGGPGNRTDWISLSPANGGAGVDWRYLNSQKTVPANGLTNATVTFPSRPGQWVLKYFLNDSLTDLHFVSAPFTIALAPDTTAPQLSNIVASNITASGATITFTTNEPATGSVSYIGGQVFSSGGIGTTHTVTLTGLTAGTSYQYTVHATDVANNPQVSAEMTFQTLPPVVGRQLTATVTNNTIVGTITGGPGNRTDWISLSPANGGPGVDWRYLNNQKTVPPNGITDATVTIPARPGQWVLKYFLNDSLTDLLMVSAPFTIQ